MDHHERRNGYQGYGWPIGRRVCHFLEATVERAHMFTDIGGDTGNGATLAPGLAEAEVTRIDMDCRAFVTGRLNLTPIVFVFLQKPLGLQWQSSVVLLLTRTDRTRCRYVAHSYRKETPIGL